MKEKIRIPKAYSLQEIEAEIEALTAIVNENFQELLILIDKAKTNNYTYSEALFEQLYTNMNDAQISLEDIQNFVKGKEALGK